MNEITTSASQLAQQVGREAHKNNNNKNPKVQAHTFYTAMETEF